MVSWPVDARVALAHVMVVNEQVPAKKTEEEESKKLVIHAE